MDARRVVSICLVAAVCIAGAAFAEEATFKVGFGKRDVTPRDAMPMWGYGDRHDAMSKGVLDPLYAKAIVIDVGSDKLALVGLDLGRSPMPASVQRIKDAVRAASGVTYVMISGSHTHHGPVLELVDEPDKGRGKFDYATKYPAELEAGIVEAINEAASKVKDARIGWGSKHVDMNRNRHTKFEPKPRDTELSVIRFDNKRGKPMALLVNFAAHPTNLPSGDLRYSAEYPGQMMNEISRVMGVDSIFMQGASGDMSCKKTSETNTIETFGKALAAEVIEIAEGIETIRPESTSIQGRYDSFTYDTRLDFESSFIQGMFRQAFFPELANAYMDHLLGNEYTAHLTTVLVNDTLALVGGSGEFFCEHANRLKARSRADKTLFFGYCNGHNMYFPTIEAAAEGGYGADATVSWVALGAGEEMINTALINLFKMLGAYKLPIPGQ